MPAALSRPFPKNVRQRVSRIIVGRVDGVTCSSFATGESAPRAPNISSGRSWRTCKPNVELDSSHTQHGPLLALGRGLNYHTGLAQFRNSADLRRRPARLAFSDTRETCILQRDANRGACTTPVRCIVAFMTAKQPRTSFRNERAGECALLQFASFVEKSSPRVHTRKPTNGAR